MKNYTEETVARNNIVDQSGKFDALRKLAANEISRKANTYAKGIPSEVVEEIISFVYNKREQLFLRYKRELEALTPGGSEYADDPETCSRVIKESREQQRQLILDAIPSRNKWSMLCAELGLPNHREVTVEQAKDAIKFLMKESKESNV